MTEGVVVITAEGVPLAASAIPHHEGEKTAGMPFPAALHKGGKQPADVLLPRFGGQGRVGYAVVGFGFIFPQGLVFIWKARNEWNMTPESNSLIGMFLIPPGRRGQKGAGKEQGVGGRRRKSIVEFVEKGPIIPVRMVSHGEGRKELEHPDAAPIAGADRVLPRAIFVGIDPVHEPEKRPIPDEHCRSILKKTTPDAVLGDFCWSRNVHDK